MKLAESKEKIPATFITSYIADAWDKISMLNSDIEAVKHTYSDTKTVCECLQDLADTYLIVAGRLQALVDNKNIIEPGSKDSKSVKENLVLDERFAEDINIDSVTVNADDIDIVIPDNIEDDIDSIVTDIDPICAKELKPVTIPAKSDSDFEYACNFDEPTITAEDRANFAQMLHNN